MWQTHKDSKNGPEKVESKFLKILSELYDSETVILNKKNTSIEQKNDFFV